MRKPKLSLKIVLNVVLLLLAMLLQHSYMERVSIFGLRPNVPLAVVIVTGIVNGSVYGGAAGIIAGFYQDAMTGKILGMYALFGLYSGALAGLFSKKENNDNYLLVILVTYVMSVFFETCVYVFGYTIPIISNGGEVRAGIVYAFSRIILPGSTLNMLVGLLVFMALKTKRVRDSGDDMDVPMIL